MRGKSYIDAFKLLTSIQFRLDTIMTHVISLNSFHPTNYIHVCVSTDQSLNSLAFKEGNLTYMVVGEGMGGSAAAQAYYSL